MKPLFLLLVGALALAACDDGDIAEQTVSTAESGRTVRLTATVSGLSELRSQNINLALAGFDGESNYAVMQRVISSTTADTVDVDMVMSNVSNDIQTVELALTNSLRKRFIALSTVQMDDYEDAAPTDTIYMNLGEVDASLFGSLQLGLFNQACIQCHGETGRTAGNLDLTAGNSYNMLVDQASTQVEGYWRVLSGEPDSSLLNIILNEGGENVLQYNHTEVVSSQFKTNLSEVRQLLRQWIADLK